MKWLEIINRLISDPTVERGTIVLLIDLAVRLNKLTELNKSTLLSALNVTTYTINSLIDEIITIYETEDLLDEDMIKLVLNKYVALNEITAEKRDAILQTLTVK